MFNIILVIQRTLLIPLSFLTIITSWLDVLNKASVAGTTLANREIDSWTAQIAEDTAALVESKSDIEAMRKKHATAKATQRAKNKQSAVDSTSF